MFLDIQDENIIKFVSILQKKKVRYMLIGGMAVNFYGVNRTTQDMDLWLAPTSENRDRFSEALQEMGYQKEELDDLEEADFTMPLVFSVWIGKEPLDCLTVVHHAIDYDEAEKQMLYLTLRDDIKLQIVSLDFLREMKIKSNREKDWRDVSLLDKIIAEKRKQT